jgi:hypothetical protein
MNLLEQSFYIIVFGGSCWAAGDLFLKRLINKKVVLPPIVHHTLAFATGNIIFSYLITIFGHLGLFRFWIFSTILIFGMALFIWETYFKIIRPFLKRETLYWYPPRFNLSPQGKNREQSLALFILILAAVVFYTPVIIQAGAPPYLRDTLVYHLLCPKTYLKAGSLIHIPGNLFSAFPKGHEVLMTLLLSIAGDRAAQGFSIVQQLAAITGIYGLLRMGVGPWPSTICTLAYATIPPAVYFSGCGYVEPALLMALCSTVIGFAIFFKWASGNSPDERSLLKILVLTGFNAGWMVAVKYTGLIYLCLTGMVLLWSQRKKPYKKGLKQFGVFTLAALPGFSWMIWNWVALGNPVYPMGWFLFGGRGLDQDLALTFSLYFDTYGMGKELLDYSKLPWRLAFSGKFDTIFFDGSVGPFLIIIILLGLFSLTISVRHPSEKDKIRGIGLMFAISSLFFVFGTQQARFWLPAQLLACVFVSPLVSRIFDVAEDRRLVKFGIILILTFSFSWNLWYFGEQFFSVGYYKPVFRMETERDFLIREIPGYSSIEFINQSLPPNSRVLCVWTGAYGYYIDRPYYTDTFVEDITLKRFMNASSDGKELSQKLKGAGVTHLFISLSILRNNLNPKQRAIFEDFLKTETHELFNQERFFILEIRSK